MNTYQIYGDTIVALRRAGHTLQFIGDKVGVTRERIRQILKKHYPEIKSVFHNETQAAKFIGCSIPHLQDLRKAGLVSPRKIGGIYIYDSNALSQAIALVWHPCERCGKRTKNKRFCRECSLIVRRYNYPWQSEEGKRKCQENNRLWKERNPDKWKKMCNRNSKNYHERKRQSMLGCL